jgi:hypothetical protein
MIALGYQRNFETLKRAVRNGDVMLAECTDVATGKPVITLCAVTRHRNGDVSAIPLAKFFDGNPYEELAPPEVVLP